MIKISRFQKTVLVFLGLVLALGLLEAGLRLGGFVWGKAQERWNRASMNQTGAYRILCLGDESTTAGAYHSFLEEILNKSDRGIKFQVIDEGYPGIKIEALSSLLESYLDTYHPDRVIMMIGANDPASCIPYSAIPSLGVINFLKSCQVYKWAKFLRIYLEAKLKEVGWIKTDLQQTAMNVATDENISGYEKMIMLGDVCRKQRKFSEAEKAYGRAIEISPRDYKAYIFRGTALREQGKFAAAEESYQKAIDLNPYGYEAYVELGTAFRKQNKFDEAESLYLKAIKLDPKAEDAYLQLAASYQKNKRFSEAEMAWKKALALNPKNKKAYYDLGDFYFNLGKEGNDQGKYLEAEQAYLKAIEADPLNYNGHDKLGQLYCRQGKYPDAIELFKRLIERLPSDPRGYAALAVLYEETSNSEAAHRHKGKAEKLRALFYEPNTVNHMINNYHEIQTVLSRRNIPCIWVQYPMLSAGFLKKIFSGSKGNIVFVDNEESFKKAIREEGYSEYFRDMSAGNVGLCTPKGNRLLAENIANTILKEAFDA